MEEIDETEYKVRTRVFCRCHGRRQTVIRRDRVFEAKIQTDGRVNLQTRGSGQMFPLTRLGRWLSKTCRRQIKGLLKSEPSSVAYVEGDGQPISIFRSQDRRTGRRAQSELVVQDRTVMTYDSQERLRAFSKDSLSSLPRGATVIRSGCSLRMADDHRLANQTMCSSSDRHD
jgi:hypothetical protein